jgi:hypothetical protein
LPHEEAVGVERLDLSSGLREVWLVGEGAPTAEQKNAAAAANAAAPHASTSPSSAPPYFTSPPDMADIPAGSLARARAHWTSRDTILWRVPSASGRRFFLHASPSASLRLTGRGGVEGGGGGDTLCFELLPPPAKTEASSGNPSLRFSPDTARFPHLFGCTELRLPPEATAQAATLLRCQLAASVRDESEGGGASSSGRVLDATAVQTAGALDDLFATDAPLGDVQGTFSVWAPTAHRVELLHWADGQPDYSLDPSTSAPRSSPEARRAARSAPPSAIYDLTRGPEGSDRAGVWSIPRPDEWTGSSYQLRVTAFSPATNAIEAMEATEPYARALTADGERCVFVDLSAPGMAPQGWETHSSPPLAKWTDVSVYELHVRDFSATDATVPERLRGKYLAFSPRRLGGGGGEEGGDSNNTGRLSAGLAHLSELQRAGLTHVHLLPTFDFGSVPERPEEQLRVEEDLSAHPPDSDRQQAVVSSISSRDAFNWGYDPVHWGVPEGSYATDPDGPSRTVELREAVMALHGLGLRVVFDVVYNHTFGSGPHGKHSVLDKIVPGERKDGGGAGVLALLLLLGAFPPSARRRQSPLTPARFPASPATSLPPIHPSPPKQRLLPPPRRGRRRVPLHLLQQHRVGAPHDGAPDGRRPGALVQELQG